MDTSVGDGVYMYVCMTAYCILHKLRLERDVQKYIFHLENRGLGRWRKVRSRLKRPPSPFAFLLTRSIRPSSIAQLSPSDVNRSVIHPYRTPFQSSSATYHNHKHPDSVRPSGQTLPPASTLSRRQQNKGPVGGLRASFLLSLFAGWPLPRSASDAGLRVDDEPRTSPSQRRP